MSCLGTKKASGRRLMTVLEEQCDYRIPSTMQLNINPCETSLLRNIAALFSQPITRLTERRSEGIYIGMKCTLAV